MPPRKRAHAEIDDLFGGLGLGGMTVDNDAYWGSDAETAEAAEDSAAEGTGAAEKAPNTKNYPHNVCDSECKRGQCATQKNVHTEQLRWQPDIPKTQQASVIP